jgi:hypothetical protein
VALSGVENLEAVARAFLLLLIVHDRIRRTFCCTRSLKLVSYRTVRTYPPGIVVQNLSSMIYFFTDFGLKCM